MATLIKVDGTETAITEKLELDVMQRLVGGYIEFVRLDVDLDGGEVLLIVNEDGLSQQLPLNVRATVLARRFPQWRDVTLVGDVVLCTCFNPGRDDEAYV